MITLGHPSHLARHPTRSDAVPRRTVTTETHDPMVSAEIAVNLCLTPCVTYPYKVVFTSMKKSASTPTVSASRLRLTLAAFVAALPLAPSVHAAAFAWDG